MRAFRQTLFLFIGLFLLNQSACRLVETLSPVTAPTVTAQYGVYTVQPGDSLSQIALRYRLTLEQLIALNQDQYPSLARNPSSLRAGWRLRVPLSPTAAQATATPESGVPHADLNQTAQLIVEGVNGARAQQNLVLLRTDVVLTRIAKDRSVDMITRDYFSHYDPQTGQQALLREIQANNYTYQYAGENIAEIKNDAGWVPPLLTVAARYSATDLSNEFVTGWLNSPEHRANILNPHYRRTGVALEVSQDGRRIVATQIFSD